MEKEWCRHFSRRAREGRNDYLICDYASQGSFDWRRQSILAWIGPQRGKRILDVGCGPGAFSEPLTFANHVVGVDFVSGMLFRARERGLRPVQAHAAGVPFPEAGFDLVLCIEVLQCVADPRGVIRELTRVLRPGGMLLVATLADSGGRRGLHRILELLGQQNGPRPRLFSDLQLQVAFHEAGLTGLEVLTLYYPFRYRQVGAHGGRLAKLLSSSFAIRAKK